MIVILDIHDQLGAFFGKDERVLLSGGSIYMCRNEIWLGCRLGIPRSKSYPVMVYTAFLCGTMVLVWQCKMVPIHAVQFAFFLVNARLHKCPWIDSKKFSNKSYNVLHDSMFNVVC